MTGGLRSFTGGPLAEGNLVRLIYTDEAGTSALEPVRVVASVVVHGDLEHRELTQEIARLVEKHVPEDIRKGFHIHAMDIFNGGKTVDRKTWSFPDRLDFLKEIVSIPLRYHVPIAVGVVWAGNLPPAVKPEEMNVTAADFEHAIALGFCLERADFFLRNYLNGAEVGTVIAEDVPEKRRFLAAVGMSFREQSQTLEPDMLRPTQVQRLGFAPMEPVTYTIENIIDVPHFVAKSGAPLLQLADVCAFAFRRGLSKQRGGDELLAAMLGPDEANAILTNEAWFSVSTSALCNTRKYWTEEKVKTHEARERALGLMMALARMKV